MITPRRCVAVASTLAMLAVAASRAEQAPVAASQKPATVASPAPAANDLSVTHIEALRRSDEASPRANVFAPKSFYVPPPKPKKVAEPPPPPPPPPMAPPLPFTYMGMLRESSDSTVVFVVRGDRLHSVRVGDVIDGTYRVEDVGADQVTFVYLPLNQKQTLKTGGSS
jgi:hypothetical protein